MRSFVTNKNKDQANAANSGDLRRALKLRHVQLIALGGIIGSGFFLSTGEVVNQVGPSVFLAYIFGGIIIYLTMLCMGELAVAIPISGSFINYTADFISPAFACGVGWSYWLSWIVYIPAECLAGGIIMQYFTGMDSYVWAIAIGMVVTCINFAKVGTFGEIEFWLSLIKVSALLSFIVLSILIFFGFIHGNHPAKFIGLQYILHHGGLFPHGFLPFFTAMVLLLVNYQGSEIVGLAAGESVDPGKMIPYAIRNVSVRIVFIYIMPVLCLVLIFPWDHANLKNSVFADALNFYGLKWAGAATSFITLTSALSCSNSGVFGIVRALHALARNGMAPEILSKLNHNAVPQNAGIATLAAIWVVLLCSYFFSQTTLYISLLLISGFTGGVAWLSLCWAQINFRRKLYQAGYTTADLQYSTPGSPYTGLIAIGLILICLIFLFFSDDIMYKIAFGIGVLSVILPIAVYQYLGLKHKRHQILKLHNQIHFNDVFPKK